MVQLLQHKITLEHSLTKSDLIPKNHFMPLEQTDTEEVILEKI